jgi:hypothetical protein
VSPTLTWPYFTVPIATLIMPLRHPGSGAFLFTLVGLLAFWGGIILTSGTLPSRSTTPLQVGTPRRRRTVGTEFAKGISA